ncbi:germ cell-less protein-like 1 [Clytia hemisphaerica]|uniref:BTB domain-containing protein n=1 Tax=Clytia hemisphaerica TaxID=252671 RepID=A0A7M5VFU8_9CNID|eukprot:TCONS_00001803-protein
MGNYIGYQQDNQVEPATSSNTTAEEKLPSSPKKRKRDVDDLSSDEDSNIPATPRKKMKTTSEYIYNTLFVSGENSDVTIQALDHDWKLHVLYLCQSPYFRSMFLQDWQEKGESLISITIPDPWINIKALDIAFGSLYSYEVDSDLLMENLIPVLAASRMFQLDGLLQHCEDSMVETICSDNVCKYHDAATRYDLVVVKERCFSWLERNMLLCRTSVLVKDLSETLLESLLSSNNFVVMQVEMDIYNFLKLWLYLQIHRDCNSELKELVIKTQKYFYAQKDSNSKSFLESELGLNYANIFQSLRLQNMITDAKCIRLIEKDGLIPKAWLLPLYEKQWRTMLAVYSGSDQGPSEVDEDDFHKYSFRCGRMLEADNRYCWRWTGFSYGIDMILTYNNRTRTLCAKRNTFSQPCNFAICLQSQRQVAMKFKAFTLTSSGQEALVKDTDIMQWNFRTDEEIPLLTLDEDWTFPVYISARMLLASFTTDSLDC